MAPDFGAFAADVAPPGFCAPVVAVFDGCGADLGEDAGLCVVVDAAFFAPPADGNALVAPPAVDAVFWAGAEGFTAVFFWALDVGPSAAIDPLILSP